MPAYAGMTKRSQTRHPCRYSAKRYGGRVKHISARRHSREGGNPSQTHPGITFSRISDSPLLNSEPYSLLFPASLHNFPTVSSLSSLRYPYRLIHTPSASLSATSLNRLAKSSGGP
jgi:hypothetical protein